MMKRESKYQQISRLVAQMENPICDFVLTNKFSRSEFSELIGRSLGGERCVVLVSSTELAQTFKSFQTLFEKKLPVLVIVYSPDLTAINCLNETPMCPVLSVFGEQELYDFSQIGHKVAEISLCPVFILYNEINGAKSADDHENISQFLGKPLDIIPCPTHAQKILFGENRRRVPLWTSLELPVSSGIKKLGKNKEVEFASNQIFFENDIIESLNNCILEYNAIFKKNYSFWGSVSEDPGKYVILIGPAMDKSFVSNEFNRSSLPENCKILFRRLINPLPTASVFSEFDTTQAITCLTYCSDMGSSRFGHFLEKSLADKRIYSGKCVSAPDSSDIMEVYYNMVSNRRKEFYLGGHFDLSKSEVLPKKNILIENINKANPDLGNLSLSANKNGSATYKDQFINNSWVNKSVYIGPNYTKLSTFNDHIGLYHESDGSLELVDPLHASPVVPAASSVLFNHSNSRSLIPEWHPDTCSGCGDCLLQCPQAALPAISLTPKDIIDFAVKQTGKSGKPVIKLTPLVGELSTKMCALINEQPTSNVEITTLLLKSWTALKTENHFDEDRIREINDEIERMAGEVEGMEWSKTNPFFNAPESIETATGSLFSVVVDPYSCVGCSLCAENCSDGALTMSNSGKKENERALKSFELWEKLPDTSMEMVSSKIHDPEYNSLAGILLSRNYYKSTTGSGMTGNSAVKNSVRIILSLAEYCGQPLLLQVVKRLKNNEKELFGKIQKSLEKALPKDNLEVLKNAILNKEKGMLPINKVLSEMASKQRLDRIDATDLSKKIEVIEQIRNEIDKLSKGPNGLGRSRYALLIENSDQLQLASCYPENDFLAPVSFFDNEITISMAIGVFSNNLKSSINSINLLNTCDQIISGKSKAKTITDFKMSCWNDLSEEDKMTVPPVIVFVTATYLLNHIQEVKQIFKSEFPLKIFVFHQVDIKDVFSDSPELQSPSLSIQYSDSFHFQSNQPKNNQFITQVLKAINSSKPAMVNHLLLDFPTEFLKEDSKIGSTLSENTLAAIERINKELKFFENLWGFEKEKTENALTLARESLIEEFNKERENLINQYEQKLRDQRKGFDLEVRDKLKKKLAALALQYQSGKPC